MIDCSHANSSKDYIRQTQVAGDVGDQIAAGDRRIIGAMIESNLIAGAQKFAPGKSLIYGQSLTDGCLGWPETADVLHSLADAVRAAGR